MKKIGFLLLGILSVGCSFATYQSVSETRLSPEYKSMDFEASLDDNKIEMEWDDFSLPKNHSFVYWKVMRSQNTDNPVYREEKSEYVTYNGDINFTEYTDANPKEGTSRYRVCAITQATDGYHRYCSKEVEKITITSETTSQETKKEEVKTTTTLTDAQKSVLDQLAADFLKKLNEKYASDSSKKKLVLGNVISQLTTIGKKQAKMKVMVTYLVEKLEATIDPLEEIKNILKVE